MSGDDLAHAIADAKAELRRINEYALGAAVFPKAKFETLLDAASRSLPPPAGQDERVRELVSNLREDARGMSANAPGLGMEEWDYWKAADMIESLAARLAEADALIAEMWSGYYPCSEMKDGLFDMWGTTKDRAIERHRALTSRAGTTGTADAPDVKSSASKDRS